ncbi:hypothetical protein [Halorarum halobium]|uniref:hypothetical protein n=1 Tax=Halorarum halobium TaxID=3075121 RepID=UPI0028A7C935|nr:hypothetical protein [Halobaculum sp. XH14]
MPFTPFHLGPALLLGALLYRRLDLPTLLLASVVVDVRAALVVYGPLGDPVHGILTTFVGGGALALVVAGVVLALPQPIESTLALGRPERERHRSAVLAGALVGVSSHVVLDSLLYADAAPFLPLDWNPFLLDGVAFVPVYGGCVLAGCLGLGLFVGRSARSPGG